MDEAIIWGKRKKESMMRKQEEEVFAQQRRSFLQQKTNYDLVRGLMQIRMNKIFNPSFQLDSNNTFIFELMCNYFGNNEKFIEMAEEYGVKNPSLEKGIMLAGNFGCGKSWMMKLFAKNQRQCFEIKHAKQIATDYKERGEDFIYENFIAVKKAAFDDPSVFFQERIGMCIDDFGTEDVKSNYGDKKNVIGDIIEQKYFEKSCGVLLHGSTNLRSDQLKDYYGERVISRMREVFNFIEFKGGDRRK